MAANNPDPTYYEILKVDENASTEEIEKAFKVARRDSHPHKGVPEWAFRQVTKAYDTLRDPVLRKAYDERLKHGDKPPAPTPPPAKPEPSTAPTETPKPRTPKTPAQQPQRSRYVTQASAPSTTPPRQQRESPREDVVTFDEYLENSATELEEFSFYPKRHAHLIEIGIGVVILALGVLGVLMAWRFPTYPPVIAGVSSVLAIAGALLQLRRKIDPNATKISIALLVVAWILLGVPLAMFFESPLDSPLYLGSYATFLAGSIVATIYARKFVLTLDVNKRVPVKILREARIYGNPVGESAQSSATLRNISTTLSQTTQNIDGTFLLHIQGVAIGDQLAPVNMALVNGNKIALVSHVYSEGNDFSVDASGNLVHQYQEGIAHIPNKHPEVLRAARFLESHYSGITVKSLVVVISNRQIRPFKSNSTIICSRKDSPRLVREFFKGEEKIVRRDVINALSSAITN